MTRALSSSAEIGVAVLALVAQMAGCGSAQPPSYHTLMPAPASAMRPAAPAGGGHLSELFVECTGEGVVLVQEEAVPPAREPEPVPPPEST